MATSAEASHHRDRQFHRSLHTNKSPINHALSTHKPQASSRLRLLVTGLPPQTSTLDIYENLCQYGSVVRIYLFENREGFNSTRAEVDFQPAPTQVFWRHSIGFETRSQQSTEIRCTPVHNQPQSFSKESPVRPGVRYEERTELVGKRLDFGVLSEPTTMMILGRSGSMQHNPKLILNLGRKEIEIQFPWQQVSRTRSAIRSFRFTIALDEEFKTWQLPDRSLVFHLTKPPWYSKQLAEAIANTHSQDARLWSIEDTWARQTDLCTHTQQIPEINGSPVALPKVLNDINIFRWTTFRFDPVNDTANMVSAQKIVHALKDWNVKILDGSNFNILDGAPDLDKQVWRLINSTIVNKSLPVADSVLPLSLAFSVRYQLEVCLSHGWLSEYSITLDFLRQLAQWPEGRARQALLYVALDQKRLFDPMVIFRDIHYSKPVRAKRLPDSCIEVNSATVTATGIIFHTPAVEITNRIIRNHKAYSHRFLRVRFEDDEYRGQTRLYPSTNNKMIMIFTRVKRALTNGIKLGDITYEFLAWGNSQLREHGAYFFAAEDGLTPDAIRAEMGDFKESVVAKKAARMGQCFSTTRPVRLQLRMVNEPDTIPDIVRNGYTFTDGVGKISPEAAALVANQLQIQGPTPCLFQFRLGGCKGVLAVSSDVPGIDVRIRKSQLKFNSLSNELEINRHAQFWQAFLNRQIIICLSSLGVPTEVFIRKQNETIAALNQAMHDDGVAINALRSNIDPNMMTLSLSKLVEAGFRKTQEPFVISLLELWRAWSLKYLKEKAKIPVEKGAFLLGTVDETATLQGHTSESPSGDVDAIMNDPRLLEKLPEIFLQYTDHKTGQRCIVEGICILARNPSLHRGDIRVVRARNVPALHHMCDVVVMPQLGDRDLGSMCSGGDLDGDDYIVIWDQELIPRFWNAEPFHYEPPVPKTAAGEIKTSDLIKFFYDYMQNDALGKIALAHLAAADFLDNGLESEICLDLVQLHSMAVDYPKTGVPAKMERRLERTHKPHFMEPKHGRTYHSHKVLGQLYDKINKFYLKIQKEAFVKHDLEFDSRILNALEPDPQLMVKVEAVKREYDMSLRRILTQHSIQTEFELWSTFVLEHSKKSRDYKFHEEVGDLSSVLKEEYYEELCDLAGGRDFDHLAPVAVAAYRIARDQLTEARSKVQQQKELKMEMPLISFPWVLQDTLIKIVSQMDDPNEPTATVADSKVDNNHKVVLESAEDGSHRELYDIADLSIPRNKVSPYLSDPLTSNIVVTASEEDAQETPILCDEPTTSNDSTISQEQGPTTPRVTEDSSYDVIMDKGGLEIDPSDSHDLPVSVQTCLNAMCNLDEVLPKSSNHEREPQANSIVLDIDELTQFMEQESSRNMHAPRSRTVGVRAPTSPRHVYQSARNRRANRQATCFYWKTGGSCKYSDDECKYAHYDTGIDMQEKYQITCHFWYNAGHCAFTDEACKFAHHDTGYYAPQPTSRRSTPFTKRFVADDSDSDDVDYVVIRNTPSDSLSVNHASMNYDQQAHITQRGGRSKNEEPREHGNSEVMSVPLTRNNDFVLPLSSEGVRQGSVEPGTSTAIPTPSGTDTEAELSSSAQDLPMEASRQESDTRRFETNSLGIPVQIHSEQPHEEPTLIEYARSDLDIASTLSLSVAQSPPKSSQKDIKVSHSWLEDLKDLVFETPVPVKLEQDQRANKDTPVLYAAANGNLISSIRTSKSLSGKDINTPIDINSSSIDCTPKTSSQGHISNRSSAMLLVNVNQTDSSIPAISTHSNLSSDAELKSLPRLASPTDNTGDPVNHDHAASPVPPKPNNVFFEDPLTSGGADNEPEIDEIFD